MRAKLNSGTRKRRMSEAVSQEALKKVTDEVNELRSELAKLRKEAREGAKEVVGYALGFKMEEFMNMSHTKSLQWVTNVLAKRLKDRVAKYPSYFGPIMLMGGASEMDAWTCAGFNRGGKCYAKWHVFDRPGRFNGVDREVRLHCCTLCKDALGVLSEHRLIDCPWLKKSTWIEITGGPLDDVQELTGETSLGASGSSADAPSTSKM